MELGALVDPRADPEIHVLAPNALEHLRRSELTHVYGNLRMLLLERGEDER